MKTGYKFSAELTSHTPQDLQDYIARANDARANLRSPNTIIGRTREHQEKLSSYPRDYTRREVVELVIVLMRNEARAAELALLKDLPLTTAEIKEQNEGPGYFLPFLPK
jgi:hypothetical protein